jgi:YbgC/YbaW family acyl-CoA thioester hydrolase
MPAISENLIAWGDCDAAGIVYYPKFFHFMDIAFQTLMRKAGFSHHILFDQYGVRVPIIETRAKFIAPTTFDDRLMVEAEVVHWGNTSFRVNYQGAREGKAIFEGYEARVWAKIAVDGGVTTTPIAEAFKTALTAAGRSAK